MIECFNHPPGFHRGCSCPILQCHPEILLATTVVACPKPSGHDVVTGWWTPNQADTQAGRLPGFGAQIMIINGAIECGSLFGTSALNRIESYKALTNYLGVSAGSNLECGNMSPFDSSSNGVHDQYWTPKPWFTPCKCQLDWVPDGYSIYNSPSNAYCQCMAACHY